MTTPAFCEQCRKYQPTNQSRNLKSLPHVLSMNAGMDNACDVEFWKLQMEVLYEAHLKTVGSSDGDCEDIEDNTTEATSCPPPNAKPCRFISKQLFFFNVYHATALV